MMNPYAFAWNDPINFGDPTGMDPSSGICDVYNPACSGSSNTGAAIGFGLWGLGQLWNMLTDFDIAMATPNGAADIHVPSQVIEMSGFAPGGAGELQHSIDVAFAADPEMHEYAMNKWRGDHGRWWDDYERTERKRQIDAFLRPINAAGRVVNGMHTAMLVAASLGLGAEILAARAGTQAIGAFVAESSAPAVGAETAAAFSPIVEGGGLAVHEAAGGHLLARHVGLEAAALDARLASQAHLKIASSFLTRAEAEAAGTAILGQNSTAISSWVNLGAVGRLPVSGSFAGGIVRVLGGYSAEATAATFVLKGNGIGSFFILTGFPVP